MLQHEKHLYYSHWGSLAAAGICPPGGWGLHKVRNPARPGLHGQHQGQGYLQAPGRQIRTRGLTYVSPISVRHRKGGREACMMGKVDKKGPRGMTAARLSLWASCHGSFHSILFGLTPKCSVCSQHRPNAPSNLPQPLNHSGRHHI